MGSRHRPTGLQSRILALGPLPSPRQWLQLPLLLFCGCPHHHHHQSQPRSQPRRAQPSCVVIRHAHGPLFTSPQVNVDTCFFTYLLHACACSIVQSNLTYKTQAPHWPVLTPSLGYSSGVCFLSWGALKMVRCIFTKLTNKETNKNPLFG